MAHPSLHLILIWRLHNYRDEADWSHIPDDVKVLITHTPPAGVLDDGYGCAALKDKIAELSNLKMHLFGHIHQAHGMVKENGVCFSNAATVNNVLNI